MIDATTITTPAGPLSLLVDDDGAVVAAGFTDLESLQHKAKRDEVRTLDDLGDVTKAVLRWLDGDLSALDDVAVRQPGTPYQQAIWDALRRVPTGTTTTYTALAADAGLPTAVRAAGSACGRNLVAPFVPCHRAVRSDGGLGGYAYGLAVKRWLLTHEQGYGVHTEG